MVNLQFIKATACPWCGCTTVVMEKIDTGLNKETRRSEINRHENGAPREFRDFLCGALIQYVPAVSKESWAIVCREQYNPDVQVAQPVDA